MDGDALKNVENSLDVFQEFIFELRKFFRKNPDVSERFIKSTNEKEELIF